MAAKSTWSVQQVEILKRYLGSELGIDPLARVVIKDNPAIGKSFNAVRCKILKMKRGEIHVKGEDIEQQETPEGRVVHCNSSTIRTVNDLLRVAKIDLTYWEVTNAVINKYDQGAKLPDGTIAVTELFQVKVWLKKSGKEEALLFKEEVLDEIKKHAPRYKPVKRIPSTDTYLLEVSPFDLHIGKLAWGAEVDGASYDSKIACEILEGAIIDLLERAKGFPIGEILFVVGNDLLHTDGINQTTTGGTRMDADSRHQKMFGVAWRAMVQAIDMLREVAHVTVLVVPGNHDRDSSFKVGEVLFAWYRNDVEVTIDNAPTLRKYYRYGNMLLGFSHGCDEKHDSLPMIMANERKLDWSETEFHYWHLAHFHTKRQTKYTAGNTLSGVEVVILPSLCGTDAWHHQMGYVKGPRAMQAFIYHPKLGEVARLTSSFIE